MEILTENLIIIDGTLITYRIMHVLKPLWASIVGKTLLKISSLARTVYEAKTFIVFDKGSSKLRLELHPGYKGNRPKQPEEFYKIRNVIVTMSGVYGEVVCEEGIEGDDLMAGLVKRHSGKYQNIYIYTLDKDIMQLVAGNVYVVDPYTMKVYDRDAVFEKYGVYPEDIVLYLSLMGDTSDGIEGIPGVGSKTAAKLINEHKTLDAIIENNPEYAEYKDRVLANIKLTTLYPELLQ